MPTKSEPTARKQFPVIPAGTHVARCYNFLHIGHIPNNYPGAKHAITNKIRLTWELPEELHQFKEGVPPQPMVVSQEYTLSMFKLASLRKIIQSWTGIMLTDEDADNFDVETLVGMDCLLTITHIEKNGQVYPKIANITQLPGKMVCPDRINPPKIINWENMTKEILTGLPDFLQKKLQESTEYKEFAERNGIAVTESIAF